MRIGNFDFKMGKRTYIVGILNITPDSFSDGGSNLTTHVALSNAMKMINDGADIIEIGGESTRPGSTPVSEAEEFSRIMPIISAIKEKVNIAISVDTKSPRVAEFALQAGANMINDVSCLRSGPTLAQVCANYEVPLVLMHSRAGMEDTHYDNLLPDVIRELQSGIDMAINSGMDAGSIILDPGIGFSKTKEQNLEILNQLEAFTALPYPVMLGTSRKSFIGKVLGDLPPDDRLEGTLATTAIGIMKGCRFIRVHDVKENARVAVMTDAILGRSF